MKGDSGPAFPWTEWNADGTPYSQSSGMTLRQYYAGQAMASVFAPACMNATMAKTDLDCAKLANMCFTMADAMIQRGRE